MKDGVFSVFIVNIRFYTSEIPPVISRDSSYSHFPSRPLSSRSLPISADSYLFLDVGETEYIGDLKVRADRPSFAVLRQEQQSADVSVFLDGRLLGKTSSGFPSFFRLGSNLEPPSSSCLVLRKKPDTEFLHCAVLRSPLAFSRTGKRAFQVRMLSHSSNASETLAVGALFAKAAPSVEKAEFIDEVDDGRIVAWGFSGLYLLSGDFQDSPGLTPGQMQEGDLLDIVFTRNDMEISLNGKLKLTKSLPASLTESLAFPVFDLIGGCGAVEVQGLASPTDAAVSLVPAGRNLLMLAPNAVGYRPKAKSESRTAISGAPLEKPQFELVVLRSQTDPMDSEGLTVGFAWNRDSEISIKDTVESPDLLVSDKLWLVGFDGEFYDGDKFVSLREEGSVTNGFHGRVFKEGDTVTVRFVDNSLEVRRNGVLVFLRKIGNLPQADESGCWWAVVDLMGSVSAVAAFQASAESTVDFRKIPEESVRSSARASLVASRRGSDHKSRVSEPPEPPASVVPQPVASVTPPVPAAPEEPEEPPKTSIFSRIKTSISSRLPGAQAPTSPEPEPVKAPKLSIYSDSMRASLGVSESFRVTISASSVRASSFVQTDKHPHVDSDDTPVSSAVSSLPSDAEYVPPDVKRRSRS